MLFVGYNQGPPHQRGVAFKEKLAALEVLVLHYYELTYYTRKSPHCCFLAKIDCRVVIFFVFDMSGFLLESGVTQLELLKPKLAVDCCFLVVHYYELT